MLINQVQDLVINRNKIQSVKLNTILAIKSECLEIFKEQVLKDPGEYSVEILTNLGKSYLICAYYESQTLQRSNIGFFYYWLLQLELQPILCPFYLMVLNELPNSVAKNILQNSLETFVQYTKTYWDSSLGWDIGYLSKYFLNPVAVETFVSLYVSEKFRLDFNQKQNLIENQGTKNIEKQTETNTITLNLDQKEICQKLTKEIIKKTDYTCLLIFFNESSKNSNNKENKT